MYSANKFPELTDYAPKNWEVKKVKYVFTERKEMNNPVKTTDLISLTYDRGVIPHAEKGNIGNKQKDDFAKYQLVYPDDLVINSMNVIIGSAGLSKYFGLVSPVYYILTPRKESGVRRFFIICSALLCSKKVWSVWETVFSNTACESRWIHWVTSTYLCRQRQRKNLSFSILTSVLGKSMR